MSANNLMYVVETSKGFEVSMKDADIMYKFIGQKGVRHEPVKTLCQLKSKEKP